MCRPAHQTQGTSLHHSPLSVTEMNLGHVYKQTAQYVTSSCVMDLRYSGLCFCLYVCVGDSNDSCSPGEYFNSSTQSCQPCSESCTTGGDCPGCRSQACHADYYYDVDWGGCRSCAELCHQAEVHGTLKKCMDLCPVETARTKSSTHSPQPVPSTAPADDGRTEHPTNHAVHTALVVAVLVTILSAVSVATLAFLQLKKVMKNHPRCVPTHVRLTNTDLHQSEFSRVPNIELGIMHQQHNPSLAT